jgi:hypothetical protein
MKRTRWLWLVLLALGLGVFAPPAAAQQAKPDRRYVELEFDADADALAQRIKKSGELESLTRMVERVLKNPDLKNKLLNSIDLNDPNLQRKLNQLNQDPQVRDFIKNLAEYHKNNPKDFQTIRDLIEKEQVKLPKDLKIGPDGKLPDGKLPEDRQPLDKQPEIKFPDNVPDRLPPEFEKPLDAKPKSPELLNPDERDEYAQWMEKLLNRIDQSALGERLANSEAWQQSKPRLEALFADKKFNDLRLPRESLQGLAERLKFDRDWRPKLNAPRPQPDMPDRPPAGLPRPNVVPPPQGNWLDPRPRPPADGDAPPAPGGGPALPALPGAAVLPFMQTLLWAAILAAIAVLVAVILRRGGFALGRRGHAAARPADWPHQPHLVSTRAELIAAFEYLSLLLLGPNARTWNHRDIAAAVGATAADRQPAADELAALYEQARYTPDDGPLAPAAVAAARRDLCLLAGVRIA